MATKNDITGDALISKLNNKAFEDNFDRIFRKKEPLSEYPEYDEDWSDRIEVIGQNGNIGYKPNENEN